MFGLRRNKLAPETTGKNPRKRQQQFGQALNELFISVGEKSEKDDNRLKLSSLDIFGKTPPITWNNAGNFKTKTGVLFTLLFCVVAGYVLYGSSEKFLFQKEPNVSEGSYFKVIPSSSKMDMLKTNFPSISMAYGIYGV